MCGRFALYSDPLTLARRFGAEEPPELRPRYNVAPTQDIPTVREESGKRGFALARWGLIPHWAKDNPTKETLAEAKTLIEEFLQERGLSLSQEKTKIVHIEEGFDFLGWNFRKYGGKLLIKPAKKNVQTFLRKIRKIIKDNRTAKQENVIKLLKQDGKSITSNVKRTAAKATG